MTQTQANKAMICARCITAEWNARRPDQDIAWEIVEEAMIAYIRAKGLFDREGPSRAASDQFTRHESYRARMPASLASRLFDFDEK